VPATIVMPLTTPQIKVQAVMDLGGEAVLHGDDYDAAFERAQHLVRERNLVYVHAFDDPDVIAGQGTIGLEIMRQCGGDLDAVFVPVGGGGLIAGIAVYIKSLYPRVRIVGVEPNDANAMYESLQAGRRVILDRVGLFADGVAVKRVGEEPFTLAKQFVDEIVLVNTDEICAAIQDIFEETRTIVEPSGALALAGIRKVIARDGWRDKRLAAINSGANMNFDRLRHIAERASLGGEREALLAVEIPEQPGSFLHFCGALGSRSVTEFNYRYDSSARAQIFAGFSLGQGRIEKDAVIRQLREAGYSVHDMSDSELAKQHVRFMIGGHARELADEVIYRFEFPERPGALLKFLQAVGTRWNITLFHYRNHGSDYGRVLAGIQVPKAERPEFTQHLNALHYPYNEETANPAYKMFLGA
ncbi:MAG TPA: threonine ammonia-lyase, biosynthetic, partial [Steroidobacteraceae bacterium]|nr:threonine ammonia-lyase, biosynthetic [Steroidobacteraceae bacterium]